MEVLTAQGPFDELLKKNTLMVKRIAYYVLKAEKHYNPEKGASFETYAGIRIRGYMLDEVRRHEWVPRSVYRHSRLINEAIKKVENRLGRDAKNNEIADELNLDLDEYHALQQDAVSSHLYGFEDLCVTQDILKEEEGRLNEPHERILHEDMAQHLMRMVETLPPKERLVIALYYERDLNLKEIGEVLQVSESRISQIHTQAMARLRTKIKFQCL